MFYSDGSVKDEVVSIVAFDDKKPLPELSKETAPIIYEHPSTQYQQQQHLLPVCITQESPRVEPTSVDSIMRIESTVMEPQSATPVTEGHPVVGEKRKRGRPKREDSEKDMQEASTPPLVMNETKTTDADKALDLAVQPTEAHPAAPAVAGPKKPAAATPKKPRDTYYCKHCDTTFPVGFFRNVQQFGAHCSNCSRGRSLQAPDDTYASRLPTRLQRALKRKKRQEEGGGVPRKRGRKSKKERSEGTQPQGERPPRERRKQKVVRQRLEDMGDSVSVRPKRRERKVAKYNDAYVYEFHSMPSISSVITH